MDKINKNLNDSNKITNEISNIKINKKETIEFRGGKVMKTIPTEWIHIQDTVFA